MDGQVNPHSLSPDLMSHHLGAMFSASSIAFIGATERSSWTRLVLGSCDALGYCGQLHLVNRRGATIFGRTAVTSCSEINERVDLALIAVPATSVPNAMRDASRAGIQYAVVLAAEYGEEGELGSKREGALIALADELGMLVLGPNCIGFANILDGVPGWFGATPTPMTKGNVALVSQSGASAVTIAGLAGRQNIGLSHLVSTGNEAMVDVSDVIATLIEHDGVQVVCAFIESVRRPQYFLEVARSALLAGKAIVVLKTGATSISAASAISHTGALVGDDRVVDAALRSAGVIRVKSFEEMVATAGLVANTGVLAEGGLGLMTNSGGIAGVAADLAGHGGISLPAPERRGQMLGGQVRLENPLDLTGLVFDDFQILEEAITHLGDDPAIAIVAYIQTLLPRPERIAGGPEFFKRTLQGLRKARATAVLISATVEELSDDILSVFGQDEGPHLAAAGLSASLEAIRNAIWWSERVRQLGDASRHRSIAQSRHPPAKIPRGQANNGCSEPLVLEFLAEHGIPVVPWRLARTADEAAAVAKDIGLPAVVKIASPDIPHKTDIGGVIVDLTTPEEVRHAFQQVMTAGRAITDARIDGVIVAPMRDEGLDLLIGALRDPDWGLTLTVGIGGSLVEVLADSSLRLLPVQASEISVMLSELRGHRLLQGIRGGVPVDRNRLVEVIMSVAVLADTIGDDLEALEINPLRVVGDRAEVLDAMCIFTTRGGQSVVD